MEKMRLIVLADLPAQTRRERKESRMFREWLFANGFTMLQEGVYTRLCHGRKNTQMYEERVRGFCPKVGLARLLIMTEKQFDKSLLFAGDEAAQESQIGSQLDIFL